MTRPDPHASYRKHVSSEAEAVEESRPRWECMGIKQSLPEPGDCNWPDCGCDERTTEVIEALLEQGWLGPQERWTIEGQLATARKALEFYAEPKNYSDDYWRGMWKTARAALNSGEQKQIEDWPYPEGNPTSAQDLK